MLIQILATVLGIMMSLAYYPQAYRIWKNKSAKNVSTATYAIFSVGTTTWLIYGFYLRDLPIILSFLLGVIGSWTVLALSIIYRR